MLCNYFFNKNELGRATHSISQVLIMSARLQKNGTGVIKLNTCVRKWF